jgi:protein SCO1/2
MRGLAAALLALALGAAPATAGLTPAELGQVGQETKPGAQLPLSAVVQDISGRSLTLRDALEGRPALLMPVEYSCRALCGPALAVIAPLLTISRLRIGRDFSVLLLGIDPRDDAEAARALTQRQLGDPSGQPGLHVLMARADVLHGLLDALGFRAVFDPALDRFAHPAAAFALAPDGRVVRTLSTLAMDARDLDLAMTEAAGGSADGFVGRLVLLCYGFDPVQGVYTPAIRSLLMGSSALTLAGLCGLVLSLRRRARRTRGAP